LLENNPATPERIPRFAEDGQTGEEEDAESREGEGAVEDPARVAFDRRHVDREAENHGLGGEESGHAEAQPGFGLAIKDKFLAFPPGGRALAAGGHGRSLKPEGTVMQCGGVAAKVDRAVCFPTNLRESLC
jgi:hypothetical protein